jgi:hypothetical protein
MDLILTQIKSKAINTTMDSLSASSSYPVVLMHSLAQMLRDHPEKVSENSEVCEKVLYDVLVTSLGRVKVYSMDDTEDCIESVDEYYVLLQAALRFFPSKCCETINYNDSYPPV